MVTKKKPKGSRSSIKVALVALALGVVSLVLLYDMDHNIIPFLELNLPDPLHSLVFIGVIVLFVWFSLRLIGLLFEAAAAPSMGSYGRARSLWKTVGYSVWALVLTILFFYTVGSADSIVLSLSLIGAALTFVLQKPLLNILGWVFITYNRMYDIGDRVSIGETRGYVTDIKVMNTSMFEMGGWMTGDTFTGRIAMVPNLMIFDMPIYNYTRDSPFVWDEVNNLVTYESDIDRAKQHMLDAANEVVGEFMANNHDRYVRHLEIHDLDETIPDKPTLRIILAESGVNLSVVFWLPADKRRKLKSEIAELIWRKFSQDPTVEIAYPHLELVKHEKS